MFTKEQDKNFLTWITALESGDYRQGTNNLKSNNSYCCLGVACELFKEKGKSINGHDVSLAFYPEVKEALMLPLDLGFDLTRDVISISPLTYLNDEFFNPLYPDFANVLPALYAYYEENRYEEVHSG